MALDKEYFDSIHIDIVKKKYYNANKVEAVFKDIRTQAEALQEENLRMRAELEALNGKKAEIGDAVLSAQAIYRNVVEKAKAKADEILADAKRQREELLESTRQQREELLENTRRQQDYAVQRVEDCYSRMKEQHMACIEALNAEWQEFLCGLFPEDEEETEAREAEELPGDLKEKVGTIAKMLFSMDAEDEEE